MMLNIIYFVALCGLVARSYAHFTTGHLLVNGTDTGLWKHVLEVGVDGNGATNGGFPPGDHFGKTVPQYRADLFTTNITCGRNAFDSMDKTDIADVVAGEEIGFRIMSKKEVNSDYSYASFAHTGPGQIWLSRAPNDDLKAYKGDGDWFKVAYAGPENNTHWKLYGKTEFNFTLPRTTPPGKYLMRFEFFMPTSQQNYTQWFINCALIKVMGSGGGVPTGFVEFPGAYDLDDRGLWIPYNQDFAKLPMEQMRLLDYKPPGPAVWTG